VDGSGVGSAGVPAGQGRGLGRRAGLERRLVRRREAAASSQQAFLSPAAVRHPGRVHERGECDGGCLGGQLSTSIGLNRFRFVYLCVYARGIADW